ncbi:MAG: MarR family transcriptional regulator [Actinomycetota bacterium]|nr:MarR family transcriptional regulator [Rubrobacteraceae bacterium]MBA3637244.1 MarR family transcriptional regulator [Rubrobacteraceae bacterium]MBA3701367.1 MarR family transcriptional regulator [Rubrobacteraceae bacterium]MDQ3498193.1 MarR family transcriptional regulator [Actinomycetota bacterium]
MLGNGATSVGVHPIRENTSFVLAKVCKAHRAYVGGLLAGHGLHVGQEMVLVELWQDDGLRGGELAARLRVEPPTVTKMLRRLEGCGLVERRQVPTDARSFRVHLTEKGRALEEQVVRCWAQTEETALAGLSAGERQTFRELLIRVRSNLDPEFEAE